MVLLCGEVRPRLSISRTIPALWDCSFLFLQKRHMQNGGDIFRKDLIPDDIGPRLLLARLQAGLTQEELARLSGVSRRAIIAIEPAIRWQSGEGQLLRKGLRIPHASTVRKLARVLLDDEIDQLMTDLVPAWPEASKMPFGFGERSAVRRMERGMTQAELAKKVGVNVSTISRFERNMPSRKFFRVEQHPHDGPAWRLKSHELAEALGFGSVLEHEAWAADEGG
jgi:transcriptional regulator with XRE-family HTH domain